MLDLEDLFFLIGVMAVIITFTIIFLQVLSPPYNQTEIVSTYVNSHINFCSSKGENISCLISRLNKLQQDTQARFELSYLNIIVIDSSEGKIKFIGREDLRDDEVRVSQSISSCNLFRNCPRLYFKDEHSNYQVIIV
ncbi:MAG: hypothetical protein ACMXYB_04915 [Candidatus Woesearchaeota archaeon]